MKYYTTESMPLVLEVRDIIDTLCIGRNKAYDLIKSGELRAVRVGNTYKIPREAFIAFLRGESA